MSVEATLCSFLPGAGSLGPVQVEVPGFLAPCALPESGCRGAAYPVAALPGQSAGLRSLQASDAG